MPHSSGGGSHGGGFHSGSGSYGSHGGDSAKSLPPLRRSDRPFDHCHTYVYYRNYVPYYVYTDRKIEDSDRRYSKGSLVLLAIVFLAFMLFGSITIAFNYRHVPDKLASIDNVAVLDEANILDDAADVEKTLEKFKEDTGIAVIFETANNDTWINNYANLESYAYEQYVINFSSESSWYIVYSEPAAAQNGFNGWYFEGMQGDDTDSVLDSDTVTSFNKTFEDSLLKGEKVGEAFIASLTVADTTAMSPKTDVFNIGVGVVLLIVGLLVFFGGFIPTLKAIKKNGYNDSELKEIDEKTVMITCPYCHKQFFNTDFKKCPFCHKEL